MAWGYNPYIMEKSPYHGAYLAVVESVCQAGRHRRRALRGAISPSRNTSRSWAQDPARWGKPLAALLGAFRAQMELEIAAIGGKDSMSGSFEDLDVPPTLVSFAVTTANDREYRLSGVQGGGPSVWSAVPRIWRRRPARRQASLQAGLPDRDELMMRKGKVAAAYTPDLRRRGRGRAENGPGQRPGLPFRRRLHHGRAVLAMRYGAFVLELAEPQQIGPAPGHHHG